MTTIPFCINCAYHVEVPQNLISGEGQVDHRCRIPSKNTISEPDPVTGETHVVIYDMSCRMNRLPLQGMRSVGDYCGPAGEWFVEANTVVSNTSSNTSSNTVSNTAPVANTANT